MEHGQFGVALVEVREARSDSPARAQGEIGPCPILNPQSRHFNCGPKAAGALRAPCNNYKALPAAHGDTTGSGTGGRALAGTPKLVNMERPGYRRPCLPGGKCAHASQ